MPDKFYITTTLPYVNSDPHLGFALEIVQADVIARYHKLLGQEVFFNTGTDEHGQKVYTKARESGKDIQAYVDEYADKFKQLMPALGVLSDIHFIRTTDEHHKRAAQEFWRRCDKNGDIYKKNYQVKYCVGCELEKTESDLDENGRCLIHPHLEIELIEEENYFFRWSKYQERLLKFYGEHPDFVVPNFRFNEIKQFVQNGLQDFSISRLKSKMSWGVPVPGDDAHVMYVWFDALINYISTLGWPDDMKHEARNIKQAGKMLHVSSSMFHSFWPGVQIAGKDNLRQQSAMWQAMLMSAGLPNSKQIIIHGFINSGGQKMSKSLGNVADPYDIIDKLKSKGLTAEQATDALRYHLTREIPAFEDGDYTWEKFVASYNAGLANGIGNLTSRILKMAAANGVALEKYPQVQEVVDAPYSQKTYAAALDKYELKDAMDKIWSSIQNADSFIQKRQPFKKIKTAPESAIKDIKTLLLNLCIIAAKLAPVLPSASERIYAALNNPSADDIPRLFPRIEP